MLNGRWREDLEARVRLQVGTKRAAAWKTVDMSSNVLASTSSQLACVYNQPPSVEHPDVTSRTTVERLLMRAGWSSLMQRFQRDLIGLRENVLHVTLGTDASGQMCVNLRPVAPHLVSADPDPECPERPIVLREARYRRHETHGDGWYWDVYDVSDPTNGTYRILTPDRKRDVTAAFVAEPTSGASYPYVGRSGRAYLPYVVYHASRTGQLWDSFFGCEIVDGTLQAGVHYSHLAHAMRSAGFPQRGFIGGRAVSSVVGEGETRRHEAIADPALLLYVEADADFEGQPREFQFKPGADIGTMSEAISKYERRVASFAGLDGSDFVRMSGDPRSGYALLISREGKREASKQYELVLEHSDAQLFALVAVLVNGEQPSANLAEDGYGVRYRALPLSAEERDAVLQETLTLQDRGFIDEIEARERLYRAGIVRRPEDT
jgi:hypothetical protein